MHLDKFFMHLNIKHTNQFIYLSTGKNFINFINYIYVEYIKFY